MPLRMPSLSSLAAGASPPCFAADEPESPPSPTPPATPPDSGGAESRGEEGWSRLLPELLIDIARRVESSEDRWPGRRSVVALAGVCRRWRSVAVEVVRPMQETGRITFPSSLKEPGPKQFPMNCFIKRNQKDAVLYLYLNLTQAIVDEGKFLLAARRFRYSSHAEYVISLDPDDYMQGSRAYVGKLRSDFLGTNFTICDGCPPHNDPKASSFRPSRRFASSQVCPQIPADNSETGEISYRLNLIKSRGPRRMICTLQSPSLRVAGGDAPLLTKAPSGIGTCSGLLVLKNKSPMWHEHLQCWCLNFHGRVTVASVKNFQLVALPEPGQAAGEADVEETVLLQFGKVGDDLFSMDYRSPLSAFQAFAICLTTFGTKFACE